MTDASFTGATRDPVALLEQLLGHVGGLRRDMAHLQEDMAQMKQDMAQMKQDMAQMKQDMAQMKQDITRLQDDVAQGKQEVADLKQAVAGLQPLRQEVAELRREVGAFRAEVKAELRHFLTSVDEEQAALRTLMEASAERKAWLAAERVGEEWRARWADVERRLAELEAAERRRREAAGD